jgi:hypothetical protein
MQESRTFLSGRADAGHPDSFVPDLPLNALLNFRASWPQMSRRPDLRLPIVDPEIDRFVRRSFDDQAS